MFSGIYPFRKEIYVMKKWFRYLVIGIMIAIVVCNYKTVIKIMTPEEVKQANVESYEIANVDIVYDATIDPSVIDEVKTSVMAFPASTIKAFIESNWKIIIVRGFDEKVDGTILGSTDYVTKTIKILYSEEMPGTVGKTVLHEFCHFVDVYYDGLADNDKFKALYAAYKETYIPFAYSGIEMTDSNIKDIKYAVSDRFEFFAHTLSDYLTHGQYLKENYKEIFKLYEGVIV